MKKILILSYHFPPMNVIASQRALGYANHFKKFGFEPTIVTYDWSKSIDEQYCSKKEFDSRIIREKNEFFEVIKLPINRSKRIRLLSIVERTFFSRIAVLISWILGHLDTSSLLLNYKLSERKFLNKHLKSNKYDFILSVFSPHFNISNCAWAGKKFNIEYVLDFRDLWDNRIIRNDYLPSRTEKIQDKIYGFYWRKWILKSKTFSITSKPWLDKLEKIAKREGVVITNGYENEDFTKSIKKNDYFTIIHNGSLYEHQNLELFLNAYVLFLKEYNSVKVVLKFIGANRSKKSNNSNNRFLKNPEKEIRKYVGQENCEFIDRMDRRASLNMLQSADLLLFPSFPSAPGTYSGKIFEYLGSRINILVVPRDNNVVDEIIKETNAGVSISDEFMILKHLKEKYEEWLENGFCEFQGNESEIDKYSRSSQSKKIIEFLEI